MHPVLAFVLIGIVAIAGISALALRSRQNPTPPQQYQTQSIPTVTPTPVDTTTWKTYADWKYHYSVKLPPEFASYIPGEGYTGNTIDPRGNSFVQFEDTTLSGSYPNRTAKYGFYVRIEKSTEHGDFNCTTDQCQVPDFLDAPRRQKKRLPPEETSSPTS